MTLVGKVIHYSKNVGIYYVNDYMVSRHREKWFCSCSIIYKRKPETKCKHILFIQRKEE